MTLCSVMIAIDLECDYVAMRMKFYVNFFYKRSPLYAFK